MPRLVGSGKIVPALIDAVSENAADDSKRESNREHDWVEENFFPRPPGRRNKALFREPFRDLRIHGDGPNEFGDGSIERLLLGKRRRLLPLTRSLNRDAHRPIGARLFGDGRTPGQRAVVGANLENTHASW